MKDNSDKKKQQRMVDDEEREKYNADLIRMNEEAQK